MAVNWRDIQDKATAFVHEYGEVTDEDKWAKAFWVRFFDVFGVRERSLGIFEERVKMLGARAGKSGKIDFFAPNRFLVEHKTLGKDLDAAFTQAADYFDALSEEEKPRYIIVSDFGRFRIYDLEAVRESEREAEFALKDLPANVTRFAFLTDEKVRVYKEEDPINVKAVRAIGKLYESLRASHYTPEHLSPLLTRLVFCFFADDTGIFNQNALRRYLEEETKPDGSDIGEKLSAVFQILNTPEDARQSTLVETLAALPYVNGGLFREHLPVVFGDRKVREMILACLAFDWRQVSPAIFGSMFQSVMNEKERHDLGAHYTSEENILKVIRGLFLDELRAELEAAKTNEAKLRELWEKISRITLLDPACGCGNFLVVSYRELRRIETEIIRRLYKHGAKKADAGHAPLGFEVDLKALSKLSVERMYGIELESFPAEIAKLSLWLMDHLMNVELGALFGKPLRKLPLTEQPHIVEGNALRLDWESVVPKEKLTHILGNPPFLGHHLQSPEQKKELEDVLHNLPSVGVMDYVSGWYVKAAEYIQGTYISCAFVSTNSIAQGEQVGILWGDLLFGLGVKIHFAHRTFKWSNEATGKAAVYCVIIGFGVREAANPVMYEYDDIRGEPRAVPAKHINPYLVDAPDVVVRNRSKPLCDVPPMQYGSKPSDGGSFILSPEEKTQMLAKEPGAEKYLRRYVSGEDFLYGQERWCLWFVGAEPQELRALPEVMKRVELVKEFRSLSKAATTRNYPHHTLFRQVTQPLSDYVLVPSTTSETRKYIPMGFLTKDVILSNASFAVPNATLYHFGVLESEMHMAWMRAVCGRLESRYRYSKDIVYNNFPWPENPTEAQKRDVEKAAQAVLDARSLHPGATLADLYDPNAMPADLLKAHHTLDRAVDACYGKKNFASEPERLEFLFEKYKEKTS